MEPAVFDERKRPSFLTPKQRAEAAQVALAMLLAHGSADGDELRESLSTVMSTAEYAKERPGEAHTRKSHVSFAEANKPFFDALLERMKIEVAKNSPAHCIYCLVLDAGRERGMAILDVTEVFRRAANCA